MPVRQTDRKTGKQPGWWCGDWRLDSWTGVWQPFYATHFLAQPQTQRRRVSAVNALHGNRYEINSLVLFTVISDSVNVHNDSILNKIAIFLFGLFEWRGKKEAFLFTAATSQTRNWTAPPPNTLGWVSTANGVCLLEWKRLSNLRQRHVFFEYFPYERNVDGS